MDTTLHQILQALYDAHKAIDALNGRVAELEEALSQQTVHQQTESANQQGPQPIPEQIEVDGLGGQLPRHAVAAYHVEDGAACPVSS